MNNIINSNNISTSELIYLLDAAKAIKQSKFLYVENLLIGLDNYEFRYCYIHLDDSMLSSYRTEGLIFDTKELSNFIKTITTEFTFSICDNPIKSMAGGELYIQKDFNNRYKNYLLENINRIQSMNTIEQECDISDEYSNLYNLHIEDGCILIKYKMKYFITVFSGLLPLLKSDKIFITIKENLFNNSSFYALFRIKKKKFDLNIVISYLNL